MACADFTCLERDIRQPEEAGVCMLHFKELLTKHGETELKRILTSHLIPEDALSSLLEDNVESFVNKRKISIYLVKGLGYE